MRLLKFPDTGQQGLKCPLPACRARPCAEELFAQIAACPGPRTTRAGTPAPIVRRSAAAPVNSPAFDASLPAATEAVGQETAGADTITVPMNKL
jgi:hypothetical protein